jgi:integrase
VTPERTSAKGQFRTDWQRKEVGRIRVSYGRTLKAHAKALQLLDELYENDQLDVLRALKKKQGEPGRVTIRELLAAKKAGRIRRDDVLIDLRLQRPLWSTLEELCAARPGGDTHRTNMRNFLKKLMGTTEAARLGQRAVFADLLKVRWRELQSEFSSPAYWNAVRKMVLTCTGALLENLHHQFRLDLAKKIDKLPEVQLETDVTTDQFWALIDALPEHVRPGVVTLAVTGMRLNTEYMACDASNLRPAVRAVFCPGSKTADATGFIYVAESLWPWVEAGIPAPVKSRWLRIYLHRAAAEVGLGRFTPRADGAMEKDGTTPKLEYSGITLGQLRHLALQLALDGGAQLNAVQAMARHADPKMTMRYLKRGNRKLAAEAIGRELERKPKAAGGEHG